MNYPSRVSLIVTLIALAVGLASAADQLILGKREFVRNGDAAKRQLVGQGKERGSSASIVGDPTRFGAELIFFTEGATSGNQAFVLPQGSWSATDTGFSYKDSTGVNAVRVVRIKKSKSGTFEIKAVAQGRNGPITLVPPNPGTGGCVFFAITGGDRYHMLLGPGSVITRNNARTFHIKNAPTRGLCPTTTTTTTTSSTSTTLLECGMSACNPPCLGLSSCTPFPVQCGQAPACNGTCALGTCAYDASSNLCACRTTQPADCDQAQAPACGGSCGIPLGREEVSGTCIYDGTSCLCSILPCACVSGGGGK